MKFPKITLTLILALTLALALPLRSQDSPQDNVDAHIATWDNVAMYAQNYTNQRIGDCSLVHSNGPYGENLAWRSPDLSGVDAVKMWVDEKSDYEYNSNTCAPEKVCGHYTQMVWRNSVKLGCAKVRCNNGRTFVSCNYDPHGNVIGQQPY